MIGLLDSAFVATVGQVAPIGGGELLEFVTSFPSGDAGSGFGFAAGGQFDLYTGVTVTALGVFKISGNEWTRTVKIWDAALTELGAVSVNLAGQPDGFVYTDLVTPIFLPAATSYFIECVYVEGTDQFRHEVVTTSAVGAFTNTALVDPPFAAGGGAGMCYGPCSFKYYL